MIDLTQSKQYTLSIRLSTDGFSFSIYRPTADHALTIMEKEVDSHRSLTNNLRQMVEESALLSSSYKRVNLLTASHRFLTVPLELFEDTQAEAWFHQCHPPKPNETVRYNILSRENLVVIFGIDKSTADFAQAQYPGVHIASHVSPLIQYLSSQSREGNTRKMYACFRKREVDVFCFDQGKLLLSNSFRYSHPSDMVYFLLCAWKQLGFDQERDELHIGGTMSENEQGLNELKLFVRHLIVMQPSTHLELNALPSCE